MDVIFATHSVLGLNERVVDSDDVDLIVLNAERAKRVSMNIPTQHLSRRTSGALAQMNVRSTEDDATNAAETVDTNFDGHAVLYG